MHLILYALLSASLFYLGSRAVITQALWSRYPARLASFMDCPACTGFWWGFLLSLVLGDLHSQIFVPDAIGGAAARAALEAIATGLASIVLTPIATGIMQYGLDLTGSAAPAAIEATVQQDEAARTDELAVFLQAEADREVATVLVVTDEMRELAEMLRPCERCDDARCRLARLVLGTNNSTDSSTNNNEGTP